MKTWENSDDSAKVTPKEVPAPEATRTASSHGLEQLGPHPTCSVTLCHCLALSLILRQCLPLSPTRLLSSPRDCALCGGGAPAPGRPPPSTLSRPRCLFSAWRSPSRTAGGCRLRVGLHPPFSSPSLSLGASPPLSTSSTQLWRLVTPLCLPPPSLSTSDRSFLWPSPPWSICRTLRPAWSWAVHYHRPFCRIPRGPAKYLDRWSQVPGEWLPQVPGGCRGGKAPHREAGVLLF